MFNGTLFSHGLSNNLCGWEVNNSKQRERENRSIRNNDRMSVVRYVENEVENIVFLSNIIPTNKCH
jgi:hypothetical protein